MPAIGRKAPIYWPLSTASGSYTLWLYYHRLNDQTIYTIVNQFLETKIDDVQRAIAHVEDNFARRFRSGRNTYAQ